MKRKISTFEALKQANFLKIKSMPVLIMCFEPKEEKSEKGSETNTIIYSKSLFGKFLNNL